MRAPSSSVPSLTFTKELRSARADYPQAYASAAASSFNSAVRSAAPRLRTNLKKYCGIRDPSLSGATSYYAGAGMPAKCLRCPQRRPFDLSECAQLNWVFLVHRPWWRAGSRELIVQPERHEPNVLTGPPRMRDRCALGGIAETLVGCFLAQRILSVPTMALGFPLRRKAGTVSFAILGHRDVSDETFYTWRHGQQRAASCQNGARPQSPSDGLRADREKLVSKLGGLRQTA